MHSPLQRCSSKIRWLMFGTLIAFGLIATRLYNLQVKDYAHYDERSQHNFLRIEKIISPRGNILDTHGTLLATNRPVVDVYWQGTGNTHLSPDHLQMIGTLDTILETDLLNTATATLRLTEKAGATLLLACDIRFDQLSRLVEQFPHSSNIVLHTTFKRHYPHGNCASHLVGYLGQVNYEPAGKMGFEKLLEYALKGEDGEVQKIINSLGKNIAERELKQALSGSDITTTIDLDMQKLVELAFPEDFVGTMLLMDPKTGALRALVSRPNFDPNIFLQQLDNDAWQALIEKKAFLNRAFNASYPPASIFKLVVVTAALEKGVIDQDMLVQCRGFYQFGNYRHWCMQHQGHGTLTVKQAVAKSCNILFFHIGKHINIDTLADYAFRFGLGQKANMLFANAEGLVPTSQWKRATKHQPWWPGETLSAAIGQSYLLVTPVQIARMVASIFEGYLVTPRLLEQEPIETQPLHVSAITRTFLRDSMRSAVQYGTGVRVGSIKEFDIYAKTGTAQTSSLELRNQNEQYKEHGWFVAYFQYKNQSPLTMVILVEQAGSSTVATAIARDFLLKYRSSQAQAVT